MNNVKHKEILDSMVEKGMIKKIEESWGAKIIIKYNISEKGSMILKDNQWYFEYYEKDTLMSEKITVKF